MVRYLVLAATTLAGASLACSAHERECRVGADCASGTCRIDGTCALGSSGGAADATRPERDGAVRTDGGADAPMSQPPDAAPACTNHDGLIERREVTLGPDLRAPFRVGLGVMVSTAGQRQADGTRRWDLSAMLPGDERVETVTIAPAGQWFADRFPTASYATRLSQTQDLIGVFQVTDQALSLLGVVSPVDGPAATEIHYAPPVVVLQFPLRAGARWTTTTMVTGRILGATLFYNEAYDSLVDASGVLATPYGEFPVQRVRTVLQRTIGLQVTTIRTFTFEGECYGTVGIVSSRDNEPLEEFTAASEVRRLTP